MVFCVATGSYRKGTVSASRAKIPGVIPGSYFIGHESGFPNITGCGTIFITVKETFNNKSFCSFCKSDFWEFKKFIARNVIF